MKSLGKSWFEYSSFPNFAPANTLIMFRLVSTNTDSSWEELIENVYLELLSMKAGMKPISTSPYFTPKKIQLPRQT